MNERQCQDKIAVYQSQNKRFGLSYKGTMKLVYYNPIERNDSNIW